MNSGPSCPYCDHLCMDRDIERCGFLGNVLAEAVCGNCLCVEAWEMQLALRGADTDAKDI